ncbi:MAG: sel1 repeat family protein [Deltaproteobacteria bacterium]|jgi:TPR repeat protein|nr:sel1 repeat family protein [Deltaproteobacteria bacterium]
MRNPRQLWISTLTAAFLLALSSGAFAQDVENTTGGALAPPTTDTAQGSQPVAVNANQVLPLLLVEAEKGNANAMLTIGNIYERGLYGNRRNFGKALEWYQKAADAGLPAGFFNVGISFEVGQGTAPDSQVAFENFVKAAEKGLPIAKQKLGELYLSGEGVIADPAAAVRYLTEAGQDGLSESDFLLARLYLNGLSGVKLDVKKGLDLINQLADKKYPIALNELGAISYLGTFEQPKDYKKAEAYFLQAADLGSGDAMKNLGALYLNGDDANPPNQTDALKWFTLSTAFGYGNQDIMNAIANLRAEMKPEEIQAAENSVRQWVEAKQAQAEADRAAAAAAAAENPSAATPPAAN